MYRCACSVDVALYHGIWLLEFVYDFDSTHILTEKYKVEASELSSSGQTDLAASARNDIVALVRLLKEQQEPSCQTKALERIRSSCQLQNSEATFKLRKRLVTLYVHESLTDKQIQDRLDTTLDWVKHHAPLIMHVHAGHILAFLEKDPVMKNQFETFSSGGKCGFLVTDLFAQSSPSDDWLLFFLFLQILNYWL